MLKQRGQVFLWRYKDNVRNYPGWHLSADSQACQFLVELLSAFNNSPKRNFILDLSTPTSEVLSVPNNRNATWQSPKELKISFNPDANELWDFSINNNQPIFNFGSREIKEIEKGIQDIASGRGDYSIGGHKSESNEESTCLWFWWYPEKS